MVLFDVKCKKLEETKNKGNKKPRVSKNGDHVEVTVALDFIAPKLYRHSLFWKKGQAAKLASC